MDAPRMNTDRRTTGEHIGTALRHTRAACECNLKGDEMAAVRREAEQAIAALTKIVNGDGHE